MSETDYVVFVAPLLKGAFFVSVTPIGGGGSFPYAVLSSTAALRKFVMKEMQLEDCVVEEIMQFALRREPYRYIGLLREQAQEADPSKTYEAPVHADALVLPCLRFSYMRAVAC